mgnify:CR=1 FL=1
MRSFEEWVKEVEEELTKDRCQFTIQAILDSLKINRTIHHLMVFMRWLHHYGLQYLCPTPQEIDCWIKQGVLRKV